MRTGGVDLYVPPAVGEGEPVVLVHGGWTEHGTWAALVPPLARSFSVVSYDRRGHSRSGRGPEPAPRRQDEDDLAALIEALAAGRRTSSAAPTERRSRSRSRAAAPTSCAASSRTSRC